MIHKACMPVYMNSGKIVADGRDGTGRVGKSKVLQEVLADLKKKRNKHNSSGRLGGTTLFEPQRKNLTFKNQ